MTDLFGIRAHPEGELPLKSHTNSSVYFARVRRGEVTPRRVAAKEFGRSRLKHDGITPYEEWVAIKDSVQMVRTAAAIDASEYLQNMPLRWQWAPLQLKDRAHPTTDEINVALVRACNDAGYAVEDAISKPKPNSKSDRRFREARNLVLNSNSSESRKRVRRDVGQEIRTQINTAQARLPRLFQTLVEMWQEEYATTPSPEDFALLVNENVGFVTRQATKNALYLFAFDELISRYKGGPYGRHLFTLSGHKMVLRDPEEFEKKLRAKYAAMATEPHAEGFAVHASECPAIGRDLQQIRETRQQQPNLVEQIAFRAVQYVLQAGEGK